ncbi:hypothetical protein VP01_6g2 [Puccinia sorghi]|uniref:Uncharacterized protein n=1 Tax=Puccinia sorghi TaxID=27349 RepID=A0A0L6UFZ8_9BASI|nr:hypothetical protein VP01_6g2 [Puccinia sorghi]
MNPVGTTKTRTKNCGVPKLLYSDWIDWSGCRHDLCALIDPQCKQRLSQESTQVKPVNMYQICLLASRPSNRGTSDKLQLGSIQPRPTPNQRYETRRHIYDMASNMPGCGLLMVFAATKPTQAHYAHKKPPSLVFSFLSLDITCHGVDPATLSGERYDVLISGRRLLSCKRFFILSSCRRQLLDRSPLPLHSYLHISCLVHPIARPSFDLWPPLIRIHEGSHTAAGESLPLTRLYSLRLLLIIFFPYLAYWRWWWQPDREGDSLTQAPRLGSAKRASPSSASRRALIAPVYVPGPPKNRSGLGNTEKWPPSIHTIFSNIVHRIVAQHRAVEQTTSYLSHLSGRRDFSTFIRFPRVRKSIKLLKTGIFFQVENSNGCVISVFCSETKGFPTKPEKNSWLTKRQLFFPQHPEVKKQDGQTSEKAITDTRGQFLALTLWFHCRKLLDVFRSLTLDSFFFQNPAIFFPLFCCGRWIDRYLQVSHPSTHNSIPVPPNPRQFPLPTAPPLCPPHASGPSLRKLQTPRLLSPPGLPLQHPPNPQNQTPFLCPCLPSTAYKSLILLPLTKAKDNLLSIPKALKPLSFVYFGPPQLSACTMLLHRTPLPSAITYILDIFSLKHVACWFHVTHIYTAKIKLN